MSSSFGSRHLAPGAAVIVILVVAARTAEADPQLRGAKLTATSQLRPDLGPDQVVRRAQLGWCPDPHATGPQSLTLTLEKPVALTAIDVVTASPSTSAPVLRLDQVGKLTRLDVRLDGGPAQHVAPWAEGHYGDVTLPVTAPMTTLTLTITAVEHAALPACVEELLLQAPGASSDDGTVYVVPDLSDDELVAAQAGAQAFASAVRRCDRKALAKAASFPLTWRFDDAWEDDEKPIASAAWLAGHCKQFKKAWFPDFATARRWWRPIESTPDSLTLELGDSYLVVGRGAAGWRVTGGRHRKPAED